MPTGVDYIRHLVKLDKKKRRVIFLISMGVFLVFAVFTACNFQTTDMYGEHTGYWVTPYEIGRNLYYYLKFKIHFMTSDVLNGTLLEEYTRYINEYGGDTSTEHVIQLFLTIISGAILSLSGAVYQSAMRNPMAVPTMLGTNSGVTLVQVIFVSIYGSSMLTGTLSWQYYLASYLASGAILALILICGKISGGKKTSVVDMLIAGTIVNRLLSTLQSYWQDGLSEEKQIVLEELREHAYEVLEVIQSLAIMVGVTLVILIPIIAMRFSMNVISFDDEDAKSLGISPNFMRLYALVGGALLTTTAMIHYGNIGMLSLIVPHMCRYIFGADFRRVLLTSALYGSFLLTIGWYASEFTWVGEYQVPIGTILSVVALPIMLWFNASRRRGWN